MDRAFRTRTLSICYPVERGADGMARALDDLCREAADVVRRGDNILILSDRELDADHLAILALLATAAVHHHLIRAGLRTEVGLVVETGEAKRVHDFAFWPATGPRPSIPGWRSDTLSAHLAHAPQALTETEAHEHYTKASPRASSRSWPRWASTSPTAARRFSRRWAWPANSWRAISPAPRAPSKGVGLPEIAREAVTRHRQAFGLPAPP